MSDRIKTLLDDLKEIVQENNITVELPKAPRAPELDEPFARSAEPQTADMIVSILRSADDPGQLVAVKSRKEPIRFDLHSPGPDAPRAVHWNPLITTERVDAIHAVIHRIGFADRIWVHSESTIYRNDVRTGDGRPVALCSEPVFANYLQVMSPSVCHALLLEREDLRQQIKELRALVAQGAPNPSPHPDTETEK